MIPSPDLPPDRSSGVGNGRFSLYGARDAHRPGSRDAVARRRVPRRRLWRPVHPARRLPRRVRHRRIGARWRHRCRLHRRVRRPGRHRPARRSRPCPHPGHRRHAAQRRRVADDGGIDDRRATARRTVRHRRRRRDGRAGDPADRDHRRSRQPRPQPRQAARRRRRRLRRRSGALRRARRPVRHPCAVHRHRRRRRWCSRRSCCERPSHETAEPPKQRFAFDLLRSASMPAPWLSAAPCG